MVDQRIHVNWHWTNSWYPGIQTRVWTSRELVKRQIRKRGSGAVKVLPITKSSTSTSMMTEAQLRADVVALAARLVQTERALMDTRQQVAAVPKVSSPLVDTRTVGKAPMFTGETRIGQNTWDQRNPSRSKRRAGLRWKRTRAPQQQSYTKLSKSTTLSFSWPWHCCAKKCIGNSEEHRSQQWT